MVGEVLLAAAAAFVLSWVSAVAGFGGGVAALPVFTGLFGLRTAVPVLTITQLASNASRVWWNRDQLQWRLIRRFSTGAVPAVVLGGVLLQRVPTGTLGRVLGGFLFAVVVWRRVHPTPRAPSPAAFTAVGAASGFGSALLGSVGPLTAPFFLAAGLLRGAYIGTEAACALVMHLSKLVVYGATALLDTRVALLGLALTPAVLAGSWAGKRVADQMPDRLFVTLVEVGLLVAAALLLVAG